MTIQAPTSSGSQYWNYKGSFSIVLLAIVDAHYRFSEFSVGAYGKSSDCWLLLPLRQLSRSAITWGRPFWTPAACFCSWWGISTTFTFRALRHNIMRPQPGQHLPEEKRVFNNWLFHARRTVCWNCLLAYWQTNRGCTGGFWECHLR